MPMHLSRHPHLHVTEVRHQRQQVMRVFFGTDVAANQNRAPGLQPTHNFDKTEGQGKGQLGNTMMAGSVEI